MAKFAGKYRVESHRLKGWNYAADAAYFITLVTQGRQQNLGYIENDEMILSDFGKIVNDEWLRSFEIRRELFLDEYIIMPNHLHAIVVVETHGRASLQQQSHSDGHTGKQPPYLRRMPRSISSFVAGFKSSVNSKIDDYIDEHHLGIAKYNRNNPFFQSNYYDHIIRNNEEHRRIKNYIINNPKNWKDDSMNRPFLKNPAEGD